MAIGLAGLTAVPAGASDTNLHRGPLEIRIFGANGAARDFLARSAEDRLGADALINQIDGAIQGAATASRIPPHNSARPTKVAIRAILMGGSRSAFKDCPCSRVASLGEKALNALKFVGDEPGDVIKMSSERLVLFYGFLCQLDSFAASGMPLHLRADKLDGAQTLQLRLIGELRRAGQERFNERQALIFIVKSELGFSQLCTDGFDLESFDDEFGKVQERLGPFVSACRAGCAHAFRKTCIA